VTTEALDPGDPGELRHMQGPGAHADELGGEVVTPVRGHAPGGTVVEPLQPRDLGVEQGVVVEAELLPDPLGVLEDLGGMGVLLGRHVPGLLEERHVDHRRGVALRARIPVPVPGPSEVTALFDDPDVLDAGFPQPGPGDQAGEPTADEGKGDVVGLRFTLGNRCVGVLRIVSKTPAEPAVLVDAVRAEALGPLLGVLALQRVLVEGRFRPLASATPLGWLRLSHSWLSPREPIPGGTVYVGVYTSKCGRNPEDPPPNVKPVSDPKGALAGDEWDYRSDLGGETACLAAFVCPECGAVMGADPHRAGCPVEAP